MAGRSTTGRVVVLTTHSMEEADVLSSRIGARDKNYFATFSLTLLMFVSSLSWQIILFFMQLAQGMTGN